MMNQLRNESFKTTDDLASMEMAAVASTSTVFQVILLSRLFRIETFDLKVSKPSI